MTQASEYNDPGKVKARARTTGEHYRPGESGRAAGGHFHEVCQYGYTHAQCRCPGPKTELKVLCDIPEKHAAEEK